MNHQRLKALVEAHWREPELLSPEERELVEFFLEEEFELRWKQWRALERVLHHGVDDEGDLHFPENEHFAPIARALLDLGWIDGPNTPPEQERVPKKTTEETC